MAGIDDVDNLTREKVRAAVSILLRQNKNVTISAAQGLAGVNRARVSYVIRAFKAGDLPDPGAEKSGKGNWDSAAPIVAPRSRRALEGDEPPDLAELAANATTEEELNEVAQLATSALIAGALPYQVANALKGLISEQRQCLKAQREAPKEDPDQILLASRDGALVLDAFEKICGQERRTEVLRFVASKLREDLELLPSVDPMGGL